MNWSRSAAASDHSVRPPERLTTKNVLKVGRARFLDMSEKPQPDKAKPDEHPKTKATMDSPQEEFIDDQVTGAPETDLADGASPKRPTPDTLSPKPT